MQNTEALFGTTRSERRIRIMVTLPTEAAIGDELVRSLFERGADYARINCAHDTAVQLRALRSW